MIRTVIVSAAVVLSGLFAVEIHRLATAPVWTPPVAAAADPTEPAAAPDMLRAPALDRMALSVISERPLFSPSRRPERPAVADRGVGFERRPPGDRSGRAGGAATGPRR